MLWYDPADLESFASTVAAAERAKCVADLRERGAEWDRGLARAGCPEWQRGNLEAE
jgi:hypothetical protein